MPDEVIAPITNFKSAQGGVGELVLSWTASATPEATKVIITYGKASGGGTQTATVSSGTTHTLTNLEPVAYTITAVADKGGVQSVPATATGNLTPKAPEVIQPVTDLKVSQNGVKGELKVTWKNSATEGATKVHLYQRKATEQPSANKDIVLENQTEYIARQLELVEHIFSMKADKNGNLSALSAEVRGTPMSKEKPNINKVLEIAGKYALSVNETIYIYMAFLKTESIDTIDNAVKEVLTFANDNAISIEESAMFKCL